MGSRKPRYLQCCLPLVAKITVFTVFFASYRAKTLVFTQFSTCCKRSLRVGGNEKHCILRCFCFSGTEKSSTCQYVCMLLKAWTWGESNGRGGGPPPLKANLLVTQANSCTCTAPGPILATQGGTQVAYRYLSRLVRDKIDKWADWPFA